MKKLDKYIIQEFIFPFIATFVVIIFLLVMQFFWKYVKEMAGKGLDAIIILELLFYASLSLVPLAIPLAILFSSIMSFGNFGEKYELSAIKASGIPISRVFRPLIVFSIFLVVGMYFFSEHVYPYSNYKMLNLQANMIRKKTTLQLRPGSFDTAIPGHYIRIEKKTKNNDIEELEGIFIQSSSWGQEDQQVVMAKRGRLIPSPNPNFLLLELENGISYQDEREGKNKEELNRQAYQYTKFEKMSKYIDISSLINFNADSIIRDDHFMMLNSSELKISSDSIKELRENIMNNYVADNLKIFTGEIEIDKIDSIQKVNKSSMDSIIFKDFKNHKADILSIALVESKNHIEGIKNQIKSDAWRAKIKGKYLIYLNKKFSIAISCLVLFFIGAPLGSIVRKGGIGLPFVIALIIFVLYYVINIIGENLVVNEKINTLIGSWLSIIILLPLGVFLTYKATADSSLFSVQNYLSIFNKFKIKKKHSSY